MQENLKAKYRITTEELKRAVDQIKLGNIACDGMTLIALTDLLASGDIAGTAKSDIKFKSLEHELFYNEMLAKCTYQDGYHRALIYAAGICESSRNHFNEIYDFKTRCIKWECLHAGWITGASARTLRLAFNLFTGQTDEDDDNDYTVSALFGYVETEYLLQAIKLRYDY